MAGQTVEKVALQPRNSHAMPDADCVGRSGTPGHGPYMVIYLKLNGQTIVDASCQTYGCPAAIACGSKLTEWVRGKTVEEAGRLAEDRVRGWFGQFPLGKRHCARIAVGALRDAVAKYRSADKD